MDDRGDLNLLVVDLDVAERELYRHLSCNAGDAVRKARELLISLSIENASLRGFKEGVRIASDAIRGSETSPFRKEEVV